MRIRRRQLCTTLAAVVPALIAGGRKKGAARAAWLQTKLQENDPMPEPTLTDELVAMFARLALKGIPQEFPNKPSNVMQTASDVLSPQQMHPVFFGCFDWHSSVHGHWMLIRLLKLFPASSVAAEIRSVLNQQFNPDKLQSEADHFARPHNKSFERMYGWAWALKLVAELSEWDDADGRRWREHFRPLENILVDHTLQYLPKLTFPIRTGIHPDSGFALALELDYARTVRNTTLTNLITARAQQYYRDDRDYPAHYEPSGNDFFSSGFNEADLMRRVLPADAYSTWLDRFLPQLRNGQLGPMAEPVEVSDVTDGHLVHLAGLNLSRAWTMSGIASALPAEDERRRFLIACADRHFQAGMKYVSSGHYEGEHWLATFAVYHATAAGIGVGTSGG